MHSRKQNQQRRNNHNNNHNSHTTNSYNYNTHTDYESDTAYLSDMQQHPPPPLRSNEELNFSVLRRHNPDITNILSLCNFAVIYTFSPATTSWEKINIEGTLFVCQLTPGSLNEERYTAFVLNRRGLNNFDCLLAGPQNVELTDDFVILKEDQEDSSTAAQQDGGNYKVFGIWIYSEPNTSTADTRTTNAAIISECAERAGRSLKEAKARVQAMRQDGLHVATAAAETQAAPTEEMQGGVPMGRTISLKDLFGQQRAQDDGFSVRAHHEQQQPQQQYQYQPPVQPQIYPNMVMPQQHAFQQPGAPPQAQMQSQYQTPAPQPQMQPQYQAQPQPQVQAQYQAQPQAQAQAKPDVLGDLFRRAGLGPQ